jgi:hypothetical protein
MSIFHLFAFFFRVAMLVLGKFDAFALSDRKLCFPDAAQP